MSKLFSNPQSFSYHTDNAKLGLFIDGVDVHSDLGDALRIWTIPLYYQTGVAVGKAISKVYNANPHPDPPKPVPVETCKLMLKGTPPSGYKLMSQADVEANLYSCRSVMGPYEIVALQDAMYGGSEYGFEFTAGNHLGCNYCGKMFVMTGKQTEPLDFNAPCPM